MFSNKTLLITGGTGSFGNAVTRRFLNSEIAEIRIFSRDEKKQDDMRKYFQSEKLKFYIGDVRDPSSVSNAVQGVDFIFHAAALKQVPSCEFYPLEAVKTNVFGTENVLDSAIKAGVQKVICLSTDKAVYPINAMGMSKAIMEKVMVAKSRHLDSTSTVICGTRYGNVMASRGSVIPLLIDQMSAGLPFTLTDPNMTRFMMSLDDALDLVLFAFKNAQNGDIFVQKSPAATIATLASSIAKVFDRPDHPLDVIGTRHGEKLYEVLLSREEMAGAEDLGDFYRIVPDLRDLNYSKFFSSGEQKITESTEYTSHNTTRLNIDEMADLLCSLGFIKNLLAKDTDAPTI